MADAFIGGAQERPHAITQVADHGAGEVGEPTRASLDVVAGQRQQVQHHLRIEAGSQPPHLGAQALARGIGGRLGEGLVFVTVAGWRFGFWFRL